MSDSLTQKELTLWAAGVVEGEGCFTCHSKNHPYFLMDMCDLDVLTKFQTVFPMVSLRGPYYDKKSPQYKARYRVDAFGPKAVTVMMALYPFLLSRRQEKIRELMFAYTGVPLGS